MENDRSWLVDFTVTPLATRAVETLRSAIPGHNGMDEEGVYLWVERSAGTPMFAAIGGKTMSHARVALNSRRRAAATWLLDTIAYQESLIGEAWPNRYRRSRKVAARPGTPETRQQALARFQDSIEAQLRMRVLSAESTMALMVYA